MKRILVLRGGALGDFILGLPALQAIRQAFPDAQLELVAPAAVLTLANRWVDVATPLERAEMASLFREEGLPEGVGNRYRDLDLVVLWIADRSGAVRRNVKRLGARQILWSSALPQRPGMHATDHLLDSLRPLGINVIGCHDPDWSTQGAWVETTLASNSGKPGVDRQLVAIHPGSGATWKCWPPERFARVAEHIQTSGYQVALIQGPADSTAVERVTSCFREQPPHVVTGLEVEDLATFLSSCYCYLGNDSGVTHLAAALGTPTIAIFGPTDPAVWGPRGPKVTVLSSSTECSPCAREEAMACQPRACLESVTVRQVTSALDEMLR